MGNSWLEYTYDLSPHPPGTSVQVRFRFVSDAEAVYEGVYIDDVAVRSGEPVEEIGFTRGDANADGAVTIADPIHILGYLFDAGEAPSCLDAADANDDGRIDVSDPVCMLLYLFGGHEFDPPLEVCAPDATPDGLICSSVARCP